MEKEQAFEELRNKNEIEVRNLMNKKNILERLEECESINKEKDMKIMLLTEKLEALEEKFIQNNDCNKCDIEKTSDKHICEYCQFSAKNERGLQLHIKAKHDVKKVKVKVSCKATDEYLSIDSDE